MKMKQGIAVIGSGYWGRNIVRNLSEMEVLHTVHDINIERLDSIHSEFPSINTTSNIDEILVSNAELSAGSGHIQSTMIELSDVSKNVHRESSDIADSLADISSAVTELGSISSDLVANIKVIRVSTEEVTAEMTQVNDFIDNLNKNVQELNSDVNRFHLE